MCAQSVIPNLEEEISYRKQKLSETENRRNKLSRSDAET